MMSTVASLRQLLEERYPDAAPLAQRATPALATGIDALDQILPGGGLPRGKLTAWHADGGGAAILRAACRAVVCNGERTAWIDDGPVSLVPDEMHGTLLLRPTTARRTLRTAEQLLRSGGLHLLVLAGAEPDGTAAVRLTRAAREGGGALVILARQVAVASLRVSSRIVTEGYRWRRDPFGDPAFPTTAAVEVRVHTLGWRTRATLVVPIVSYELRLSSDPTLADRRGGIVRSRHA